MEASTLVGSAVIFHVLLFIFNKYLKNLSRYCKFSNLISLQIGFMNIKWTTSKFTKQVSNWTSQRQHVLNIWFNVGVAVTLLMIIPSMILLSKTAFVSFENLSAFKKEESVLQPVLPGINLPKSDLPYYLSTLLITTVLHELGHAVAAVNEQVTLVSFGLMVWVLIPAAFVELPTSTVTSLSPWRQLKIYCAGVWHNVFLSVLAFFMFSSLPYIVLPLFQTGVGVYTVNLNQYLTGGYHDFQIGDHITQINDCDVANVDDWTRCLSAILTDPSAGFCVEDSFLLSVDSVAGEHSSCCPDSNLSQSHLCFVSSPLKIATDQKQYCLRARLVSNVAVSRCKNESCSFHQSCLTPSFSQRLQNETLSEPQLIVVKRHGSDPVLYLGQPDDIYSSVHVSDYIPRTLISPLFVTSIDHLLRYVFSFSAGLAVLNVVPCILMDGQHVVSALSEAVEKRQHFTIRKLLRVSVYLGTFLVLTNIVLGMLLFCL